MESRDHKCYTEKQHYTITFLFIVTEKNSREPDATDLNDAKQYKMAFRKQE